MTSWKREEYARRRARIYALADAGLDNATNAARLGMKPNEVWAVLERRPKTPTTEPAP